MRIAEIVFLIALIVQPIFGQTPPKTLAFDAVSKTNFVSPGSTNSLVSFQITNVADKPITLFRIKPSCGCTLTEAPQRPWKLQPNESGTVRFQTLVAGKLGTLNKTATLYTSAGIRILNFTIHIPRPMDRAARIANLKQAEANRQSVFQGHCANCHAKPTHGLYGPELFQTACGICHEAKHRASMVPDLDKLQPNLTTKQWRNLIENGKANSLMPAFHNRHGGPLSERQTGSLVRYLREVKFLRKSSTTHGHR